MDVIYLKKSIARNVLKNVLHVLTNVEIWRKYVPYIKKEAINKASSSTYTSIFKG